MLEPSSTPSSAAVIVAARVSLPTADAIVPVASWVPPEWAERLARPDGLLRPDCRAAFGFAVRPSLSRSAVGRTQEKP